jgi:hypothetical protein
MSCCGETGLSKGWEKAVASEQLCFRFVQVRTLTYMGDTCVSPGDYIVRSPALDITFSVKAADFHKYFEPLMAEARDAS